MLTPVKLSLAELLGQDYLAEVVAAQSALSGREDHPALEAVTRQVDFYPAAFAARQLELLGKVGRQVAPGISRTKSPAGAATDSFAAALNQDAAPLAAQGAFRIGEDGRLYLAAKSEHYQAALGHHFPGYELLKLAEQAGITNITHNNTRGYICRRLERELVRVVNGIERGDEAAVEAAVAGDDPTVLNRVVNLETGSLAMEAAVKMMLARFVSITGKERPQYEGRIPVFLVMADYQDGSEANYHGTTLMTQMFRGLWPELRRRAEGGEAFRIVPVKINDPADFRTQVEKYDVGRCKVAGFLHEIILMNYGAIELTKEYLSEVYEICRERDIPTAVDEIQSCMWSPEIFLFKEYGLKPDFVSVGKGFPGGMYPASRIITNQRMDNLNLFGALVTNGQEEIASLSCLVTLAYAEANRAHTTEQAEYYGRNLQRLAEKYPALKLRKVGCGLMLGLTFESAEPAAKFAGIMNNEFCIDTGCQTYKANCPPTALTKLPLIVGRETIDLVIARMDEALAKLG